MALDDNELLIKQLPHSVEAEQAVLGSILFDPQCVPEVIDKLRPDDFYLRQNREIYETIYSMFNYSLTIDPVTVLENMKQHGYYTDQSRSYLLQLIDITPTAANVKEYIDIIKDKTLLRRVAETAGDLTEMIHQGTDTGQDILEAAEMDSCGELGMLFRIALPLSKPMLSTVALFSALAYWNDWINGLYYLTRRSDLYSIQNVLNSMMNNVQFLKENTLDAGSAQITTQIPTSGVRMAIAVISVVPIMIIYPFFQKAFIKGIVIGGVKG